MDEIETYSVIFHQQICGIELIPIQIINNVKRGAKVIKCHTEKASGEIILQSFVIKVTDTIVLDMKYERILSLISRSVRPLTLILYSPPITNPSTNHLTSASAQEIVSNNKRSKKRRRKKKRQQPKHNKYPSQIMILEDDESAGVQSDITFISPHELFDEQLIQNLKNAGDIMSDDEQYEPTHAHVYNDNDDDHRYSISNNNPPSIINTKENNMKKRLKYIQKQYTLLYHTYNELKQFTKLTKDSIQMKCEELSKMKKEKIQLKQKVFHFDNKLKRMKDHEFEHKENDKLWNERWCTLNDRNIRVMEENIELQAKNDMLVFENKQCKIKMREHGRKEKERNKIRKRKNLKRKEKQMRHTIDVKQNKTKCVVFNDEQLLKNDMFCRTRMRTDTMYSTVAREAADAALKKQNDRKRDECKQSKFHDIFQLFWNNSNNKMEAESEGKEQSEEELDGRKKSKRKKRYKNLGFKKRSRSVSVSGRNGNRKDSIV